MYNKIIIEYSYNPEKLPEFRTQEEANAWYAALGRLITYSVQREVPDEHEILKNPLDTIQHVALVQEEREILSIHHKPQKTFTPSSIVEGYFYLSNVYHQVEDTLKALRCDRPFVMAAIKHGDGQYGFHS